MHLSVEECTPAAQECRALEAQYERDAKGEVDRLVAGELAAEAEELRLLAARFVRIAEQLRCRPS